MYGVTTARHAVETYRRVELRQFRLEMLVDPQQGLECAADVAIATRHDLIDGGFVCVGNHGYFSDFTLEQCVVSALLLWMLGKVSGTRLTPQSGTATHGESVCATV